MSIEAEKVTMDLDDCRLRLAVVTQAYKRLSDQMANLVAAAKQSRGWLDEQTVGDGYLIEEVNRAEKLLTPVNPAEPKKEP